MNDIERQYLELINHILRFGHVKKDRTGTGTKSIYSWHLKHRFEDGFPLLTTKKMAFKTMVTELLWFLRGDTNIKYLVDNDCHIWDGDAYKNYLKKGQQEADTDKENKTFLPLPKEWFINKIKTDDEFAKKWGELGPIYGKQWRDWNSSEAEFEGLGGIDQIANVINLLKTDPDSRRMIVNAWNVGELDLMVLPPCHTFFQFWTRELSKEERYKIWFQNNYETGMEYNEEDQVDFDNSYYQPTPVRAISLSWYQRSCDVPLGIPFNIASYGLLLMMVAKQVNMYPEELNGHLGDCHVYLNQIESCQELLTRTPLPLPQVTISDRQVDDISQYALDDIKLHNYKSHSKIHFPLSN